MPLNKQTKPNQTTFVHSQTYDNGSLAWELIPRKSTLLRLKIGLEPHLDWNGGGSVNNTIL